MSVEAQAIRRVSTATITAVREHEICAGHRVVGHEGKCQNLHGHAYVIRFHCQAEGLDELGRVIDFSVIKSHLCMWLEDNWDHRFLIWRDDPLLDDLRKVSPGSLAVVPFNPTAENIAEHLLRRIGPVKFDGTGVRLVRVDVEETRKCMASAFLP